MTHSHYFSLASTGEVQHSTVAPPTTTTAIRVSDSLFVRVYGLRYAGWLHLTQGKGCVEGDASLLYIADYHVHMYVCINGYIHKPLGWWLYPGRRMFICQYAVQPNAEMRAWLCRPAQEFRT